MILQYAEPAAAHEADRIEVHKAFDKVDFVGHRQHRRQPLQILEAGSRLIGRQVGPLQICQIRKARHLVDSDPDHRLAEVPAVRDQAGESMAGEELLPRVVRLPFGDPQHGAGGQCGAEVPAFLQARQGDPNAEQ